MWSKINSSIVICSKEVSVMGFEGDLTMMAQIISNNFNSILFPFLCMWSKIYSSIGISSKEGIVMRFELYFISYIFNSPLFPFLCTLFPTYLREEQDLQFHYYLL
eukprot:TRINITY_DN372_c0_g1_i32.p1 TRINITY_DN372_c0_g1~~TRINITY_DN372_c0_g1_i32.p1  ORF type:complete len:105 (+),score=8.10 TRINITY_DN372_c0_g1_i32:88-402(+)